MRETYLRARRLVGRVVRAIPEPPRAKNVFELELERPWIASYGIRTVLDVGANEGQFAQTVRRALPSSHIISFEPIQGCYDKLAKSFAGDSRFEAHRCAIGESEGVAVLNENEFSPSSSLLPMRDEHREAFPFTTQTRKTEVPVRTLDDVLRGRTLEESILLKMDVQGYESKVIAGASETLRRCRLVLAELSIEPLYEAEPLAYEMITTFVRAGFKVVCVVDSLRHPRTGKPLQMDVLFARD